MWVSSSVFLSTLSLRRATGKPVFVRPSTHHFYPRSPCGERQKKNVRLDLIEISIHALLAESDGAGCRPCRHQSNFYPRSPCGERQPLLFQKCVCAQFLSTLSLRRATILEGVPLGLLDISIHALLAESDLPHTRHSMVDNHFYPRSPCGERHSPLDSGLLLRYFYPRSPCGERPPAPLTLPPSANFYPRSPCGERPAGVLPVTLII